MRRFATRSMLAATCTGALLLAGIAPASALNQPSEQQQQQQQPDDPSELDQATLDRAVFATDPQNAIIRYDLDRFIERLGDQESDEDDVIVLETDILFEPNSWELPDSASAKLKELVEDVPDGSALAITGHTDSLPVLDTHDFDNQELSEKRAQAVAEVLETERSDFDITAEGVGDAQPAELEDPDDPATFAANRRVELRYQH